MKQNAKHSVKTHYITFIITCLFIAILGLDFNDTLNFLDSDSYYFLPSFYEDNITEENLSSEGFGFSSIIDALAKDGIENLQAEAQKKELTIQNGKERKIAGVSLGRSKGVLATFANKVKSGSLLISIYTGLRSAFSSKAAANAFFIIAAVLLYAAFWILIKNVILIIYTRVILEAKTYKTVPISTFFFLLKNRCWLKVALTELVHTIYSMLWGLTIIGGFIKYFSYYLVPFIAAENPALSPDECITLSRKMMNGHKLETFIFELSFIGWDFLNVLTLGLLGLFFLNAYESAARAELYATIRSEYIKNKGINYRVLNDTYLFSYAEDELISNTYRDLQDAAQHKVAKFEFTNPLKKVLASVFGVVLFYGTEEKLLRDNQTKHLAILHYQRIANKEMYPTRLSPIPIHDKIENYDIIRYNRCYSVPSIISLFFIMSIVGWVWEVTLHLITDAEFVNRGINHGPWLPIYGTGCILILLVLNKFRSKIWLEFISAIVLCGLVEYFTAYYLEMTHNGTKWWNYTGYFLNIDGRVCAEGLLVFGLGGCAFVYLLAPAIDNVLRKVKAKILFPILGALIITYTADSIYSKFYPNEGKGITDYEEAAVEPTPAPESTT